MKNSLFLILICGQVSASVFDKDDRIDISHASAHLQDVARSVPALIQKKRINKIGIDQFEMTGNPLTYYPVCSDEIFSGEQTIANCSASLIAPNKILTAAHCLSEPDYGCSTYNVVFDYNDSNNLRLHQSQIYECKKILYYNFNSSLPSADLAVIELDRNVEGRIPVKINLDLAKNDELFMIGYPMGISQKLVESGRVLSINKEFVSFKHNLDSFSVNSGSPIFNEDSEQVGVLVRGTGANFVQYNKESCYRWHKATTNEEFSEGNDLSLIPNYLLNGK